MSFRMSPPRAVLLVVLRLSVPEEHFESHLSEHLGDHVLGDGSQGVQQLALQPGLHDQQIHVYLGEEKNGNPAKCREKMAQGEAAQAILPVLKL